MSCTKKQPAYRREKDHKSLVGYVFRGYSWRAKKIKVAFEITRDEFALLIQGNCYLCNSPPINKTGNKRTKGKLIYNGLDRIDNNQGYILSNVKPCCFKCNRMKSDETTSDFIKHLERILKRVTNKDTPDR